MANKNPYNEKDERTGKLKKREDLTPIQLAMIAELLSNGGNKTKACEKLGIQRKTLYSWYDNVLWEEEYKRACEKLYKGALAHAVKGIIDIAKNGAGRDRIKACEDILKLNSYLDTNINIDENTTQNIVVTLFDGENEEE
ncbi:MAG: helix-turn-helix domain-containing protein [Anaerotignaceae bacterium]